jgi:phosphate transport system permease protein
VHSQVSERLLSEADDLELAADDAAGSRLSRDQRAELWLVALVVGVVLILVAIAVFVTASGWPSFAHNGLRWFGSGGNVDNQIQAMIKSGQYGQHPVYTFRAWPLIWSTILTTAGAVVISLFISVFISIFLVEFAPQPIARVLEPVVRVLASVPSVIYGLVGVVVLIPLIGNHLITASEKQAVTPVLQLNGASLLAAVVILSLMISPIMISIFSEGMRAVPRSWFEASLSLGVNRWRSFWNVAVRSARPALIAGTVLATARAVGESVMLAMVSGTVGFSPNPFDGLLFFFEPSRGLAPTILLNNDELSNNAVAPMLFAIATVLLFSSLMFSLSGWAARQPMKRYFNYGGASA